MKKVIKALKVLKEWWKEILDEKCKFSDGHEYLDCPRWKKRETGCLGCNRY